jgi:hypothetical protein
MKKGTTILLLIAASVLMFSACKTKKNNSGSQVHMGTPRNQQQQQSEAYSSITGEVSGTVEKEISLRELLTNPEKYSNKIVTVSGKVIKINPAIMSRNWVHITAKLADDNNHNLTITCQDNVEIDQLVTFKGQVSLNRDFGAGYTYQIIMENAKLLPSSGVIK